MDTSMLKVVDRVYGALADDDLPSLSSILREDVALDVPGRHPAAGRYLGVAGVVDFVATTRAIASESIDVLDALAGERHVAAMCLVRGTRVDRSPLENRTLHVFELDDHGLVTSIRFYNADQHAVDAFWG